MVGQDSKDSKALPAITERGQKERLVAVLAVMKMAEMICPLTRLVCLKESCQWWTSISGGRCSVYVIADSLKHWWEVWK
jgi:hypothetical protein